MPIDVTQLNRTLRRWDGERVTPERLQQRLQQLIDDQLANLPMPGSGETLNRWRALACVAGHDLGLVKLYEGHTDALAILTELEGDPLIAPGSAWAVWAAEPPQARLALRNGANGTVRLEGTKAWCSGAAVVSHALVTAWDSEGRQCLAAVDMNQPAVRVTDSGWDAVGMAATASVEVLFDGAEALPVGEPGGYLSRAGFWQGGAGIAACWFGAARAIGEYLHSHCERRAEPHAMAHLGTVDQALTAAGAVLREAAGWIDRQPLADAQLCAGRARAVVESCVETVIRHTGRALGAGPYCRDARFAQLMADLPVFIRQSHAERDLAGLAERIVEEEDPWHL